MNTYFSLGFSTLLYFFLLCTVSCNKNTLPGTENVASFGNVELSDVCIVGDSVIIACGTTARQGRIVKQQEGNPNPIVHTFSYPIHSLYFNDTVMWACGDSMLVLKSTDYGTTWTQPYDFDYFWENDRSNLTKIYGTNDFPTFAIGTKDVLFNGHMYVKSPSVGISQNTYPLQHRTPQTDVYDFTAVSASDFFVAGYGSIFHYSNYGQTMELERIGNEIFCGITSVGNTVIACAFSGKIFTRDVLDPNKTWHTAFKSNKNMRYIAANANGTVLCVGDGKNAIFTSSNKGMDWKVHNLRQTNSIVAVKAANGKFYIAQKNGRVQRLVISD
ncbi:MAG: hypothetical protein LBM68_01185 [Bacteroidales bacterium]|jgi:photosystem II stability/assembly factor-like uncharacterized protein|nr:hypothetical protein [Bacteroidales bacterium]